MQQLQGIGAADGVVAVALGQDHPVAGLHHATLEQLVHGRLADFTGLQRRRIEGHRVHTTQQGRPGLGFAVRGEGEDRHRGADARHDQRGVAAFGQGDNGLDAGEVVGGVHGGQGDAFVAARKLGAHAVAGGLAGGMLFRPQADPRHRLYGFQRVGAGGAFRREHHRIGVVQHGVGHIGDFGTGRHGVLDHRFHHLRGDDHGLVQAAGVQNDLFLDATQFGIAHLNAEVAAGHHHRITGTDQAVQGLVVGHCFGAFDLGHQPGGAAGLIAQPAGVIHVRGIAGKGHCQVVQFHLGSQLDIGLVLLGQGRGGEAAATAVDALVVGQRAADGHLAVQGVGCGLEHAHHHPAVVQQQFVADAAVLDQIRVVDADDVLGTGVQGVAGGEGEAVANLQFDALAREFGDADLRPLQVAEQGNVAPVFGRQLTHQACAGLVLVRGAVGEVETGHVEAGDDQLFEDFGAVAGGAEGGNDFAAAKGHAGTPWIASAEQATTPRLCSHCCTTLPIAACCHGALLFSAWSR